MSARKILICSAQSPRYNARLLKTASALLDSGYAVEVAAVDGGVASIQIDRARQIPLHRLTRTRRSAKVPRPMRAVAGFTEFRAFSRELLRVVDRVSPDAVHLLDYEVLSGLKPRLADLFVVYDAVEFFADTAEGDGARRYVDRLYEATATHIDRLLTVSSDLASALAKNHPSLPEAQIIHNAAEPMSENAIAAAQANRPAGPPLAVYQGGFGPGRGLSEVIEAARALKGRWRFALRGWGPLESELRTQIDSLFAADDPERPDILPPLDLWELPEWTATAQIGLIPYAPGPMNHMLATPNKLYEYPAAGVPILASGLPTLETIIGDHGFGWTFDARGGAQAITDAMESLTVEALATARKACLNFAKAHDWRHDAEKLQALYRSL